MHNPFEFDPAYNGFSKIAAADLDECDLPLAAFYWADNQISFVEEWAARRRLIHPYPASAWKANISDQRVAEGEARFVQFQTETADLQQRFGTKTGDIRAATHFAYLPPVGLLPVNPYELILVDAFAASLSEEQERAIAQFKLSNSQVFNRVRAGVLAASDQGAIFNLEHFFGDYLPDEYTIVQEDEIHNRLHQSWVQPAIQLPAPSASPSAPVDRFFEFTLADRSSVAVTGENFRTVVGSIQPGIFIASGISTAETVGVNSAGTAGVDRAGVAGFRRSAAAFEVHRGYTAAGWSRRARPDWYFVDPAADKEKDAVEPLVDILVIDELLAPYRLQLTKAMPNLITSAITSLVSGGGGGFSFGGDLATVHNNVASFMMLNAFMAAAANTGAVAMADWLTIQAAAKQPLFYVAFIRHQRDRLSRPLRL